VSGNIIELDGLTKKYGSHTVVDNLSLTIGKGEIFGLLGPNGAGKSTTILMMMGLTDPDGGSVKVCELNPTIRPVDVKRKVGYLPEDVGFYEDYSGRENLIYTARLNGISSGEAGERADQLLREVGLQDHAEKKAGKYSRGMRQRLGLADVLIKAPEVIILDEPTLGIDPAGVREFLDLIVRLSRVDGITVLFSSHLLHQVQQVCDRVGLFVSGKLLAVGNVQFLSRQLFENSPYTVEAEINGSNGNKSGIYGSEAKQEEVAEILRRIEGVTAVSRSGMSYRIECSHDITPVIARAIVGSGADLLSLSKKEYGLDDIYYRYFQGNTGHE
jgi:ABC-2 type transport system ATP-binding protein